MLTDLHAQQGPRGVERQSEYLTTADRTTTIIATGGATLGQVSLLKIEACANQSIVGVLGSEKIPTEFIYF